MQSQNGTPQRPQAILIPDQGITPIKRSTDNRTQGDVLDGGRGRGDDDDDDAFFTGTVSLACTVGMSPSRTFRVMTNARGKKWVTRGERGLARRMEIKAPIVVMIVINNVAIAGGNKAPARTF